ARRGAPDGRGAPAGDLPAGAGTGPRHVLARAPRNPDRNGPGPSRLGGGARRSDEGAQGTGVGSNWRAFRGGNRGPRGRGGMVAAGGLPRASGPLDEPAPAGGAGDPVDPYAGGAPNRPQGMVAGVPQSHGPVSLARRDHGRLAHSGGVALERPGGVAR